jgi:hypothetical protein
MIPCFQDAHILHTLTSLQKMEEELTKPDDLQHLELEITSVGEQHLADLERMYTFHSGEYYDECVDRYLSKDGTQVLVEGENNLVAVASYNRLEVRRRIYDYYPTLNTVPS